MPRMSSTSAGVAGRTVRGVIAGRIGERHEAESSAGVTVPEPDRRMHWRAVVPADGGPAMMVPGPARDRPHECLGGGPMPRTARSCRRGFRSRCCPRGAGSPGSRRRTMRLRLRQPARLGPAPLQSRALAVRIAITGYLPGRPPRGKDERLPLSTSDATPTRTRVFVGRRPRVGPGPAVLLAQLAAGPPLLSLPQRCPGGDRQRHRAGRAPFLGVIVGRPRGGGDFVIGTFQAVRPGWRTVTMGVLASVSAVTAVTVKAACRGWRWPSRW